MHLVLYKLRMRDKGQHALTALYHSLAGHAHGTLSHVIGDGKHRLEEELLVHSELKSDYSGCHHTQIFNVKLGTRVQVCNN